MESSDHQSHYEENEIDLFHILQVLLKKWKIIGVTFILSLIVGVCVSYSIVRTYTAESKVKVMKQTVADFTVDKDLNFHVIKLQGFEIQNKLKDDFSKSNNLDKSQFNKLNLSMGVKTSIYPGVLLVNVSSTKQASAIEFLDYIDDHYCKILNKEIKTKQDALIVKLNKNKKDYLTKLEELESKLQAIPSDKTARYEQDILIKNQEELKLAVAEYKSTDRALNKIENLFVLLNESSPAEICDIFKTTCSDLASISITDSDKVWSVIVEFREKAGALLLLEEEINKLKTNIQNSDRLKQLNIKKEKAQLELNAFAKTCRQQIIARKNLLEKEKLSLFKRIQDLQKFLRNTDREFTEYSNLLQQYRTTQTLYNEIVAALASETSKPLELFSFEILNKPTIVKSNSKQYTFPLIAFPAVFTVGVAFLLVLLDAYSIYIKTHTDNGLTKKE